MRNALVLVPLCIGLTSGFIVSTSIPEQIFQNVTKFDHETAMIDNSTDLNLPINDSKRDDIRLEIYKEGSEEDKNIDERSFILVNQRWSKQPYRSHSNLNKNNVAQKTAHLTVFVEDPRENTASGLQDKKEHNKEHSKQRNKKNESKMYANQSKSQIENRKAHKNNNFIEFLKTSIIRPWTKNNETTSSVVNKISNRDNKKHFLDRIKDNNNHIPNDKQKIMQEMKPKYDSAQHFKNKLNEANDETIDEILTEKRLFHLLLEEQDPLQQKMNENNDNISVGSFKYCRKCARIAAKMPNHIPLDCDCKCGRFIHLGGRSRPED